MKLTLPTVGQTWLYAAGHKNLLDIISGINHCTMSYSNEEFSTYDTLDLIYDWMIRVKYKRMT